MLVGNMWNQKLQQTSTGHMLVNVDMVIESAQVEHIRISVKFDMNDQYQGQPTASTSDMSWIACLFESL